MDNTNQQLSTAQPTEQSQIIVGIDNSQKTYYKFCGFLPRFFALVIDGIIILALTFLLSLILQLLTGQSSDYGTNAIFQLLAFLTSLIYDVTLLTLYGATVGKMLLHIRVVNSDYKKLSFGQILKRETVGKFLSGAAFNLGYLWVAVDDNKQGWHDKIAKTYVVHTQTLTYSEYVESQKDKRSHLPFILILLGIIEIIQPLMVVFTVIPQLTILYSSLGDTSYNPTISYTLFGLIGFTSISQIIYGIILIGKQKVSGTLQNSQKKIGKTLLIIGIITAIVTTPIIIISVIGTIYNAVGSLGSSK